MPRAERERQMLEVADRIFSERGYLAASMDEIAEGAGISKPMLYSYFGSKEGLFAACVRRASQLLRERIEEAASPELPPDQRLWRGFLAVFDFVEEHRRSWAVLYPREGLRVEPWAEARQESQSAMAELLARLMHDAAIANGIAPAAAEHVEPLAFVVEAATRELANWWVRHPDESKDFQALRLMNIFWMGFGNTLRGQLWLPPPGN
jgi:AcrR family transcriptional regulator